MKLTTMARGPGATHAHRRWAALIIAACLSAAAAATAPAPASGGAPLLAHATDLGPVSASSPVEVTVWLRLHDEKGLDSRLEAQQSGKAAYLSNAQIQAQFAPSAADVAKVSAFLKAQGLTVTGVGQGNLYVKASGTAARVQSAFQVELHQYNFHGREFRASARSATLPPDVAPLVSSVGGLSTLGAQPHIARNKLAASVHFMRPSDAEGMAPRPVSASASPNGSVFSGQCFFGQTSESFSGKGVTASYQGNRYGADITNTADGTVAPCGYQPSEIQTAYNLTPLYQAGLDGTGTTIAIVDAFGSTTIARDARVFAASMGLPPVNLTIVGTPTESNFSTDPNAGWATETTLDVEWVHAIAPGAKILLVIAPTNFDSDLFAAIATASATPGVVAISNSWGNVESDTDVASRASTDAVLKMANARGQSVNFSTGDSGNFASDLGYIDVSYPSGSPFATAVGGVTVALDSHQHIAWQTSWGTNLTEVVDRISLGSPPIDPPFSEPLGGGGGGGGVSNAYPQPSWQRALGGSRRLQPDISWVADPFTGVEYIFTGDSAGDLFIGTIGGTSVACPMFTGLWGIATQRAHHPLGNAAPRLYQLPAGAITDVTGAGAPSSGNVTGTIHDANGTEHWNTWELAAPLSGAPTFVSALYNSPFSTRWFVISFGLDTSLPVGPGWDQATGLGTPNGWSFVQAFAGD
ncbi:MAG TPA: S53 family peptidase [Steroidobacteraceae bacterium]|nr:S53 family peptidase [Steroidobacteraceae bacterium]